MACPEEKEFRAKLEAAFKATDTDNSGSISQAELKNAMKKAGLEPTDDDVKRLLSAADYDKSGQLNLEEFSDAIIALSMTIRMAMALRALFQEIDADGSGFITADELKKLLQKSGYGDQLNDKEIGEVIKACDDNGDGKISFEEFVKNMCDLQ